VTSLVRRTAWSRIYHSFSLSILHLPQLHTTLYNVFCGNGVCFACPPSTRIPSPAHPDTFLHRIFVYPAIIMYRKTTGHAADKSSAAITDTNPTLDVPCGPRQRSTRSVVDNIIIIPWKEPSQSRAIFLVLKASCGLMTSADVSTCVMTEEDKLAPILSVDRERRDEAGRGVCGSRIEGGFRE
jgi:hypothetical protein